MNSQCKIFLSSCTILALIASNPAVTLGMDALAPRTRLGTSPEKRENQPTASPSRSLLQRAQALEPILGAVAAVIDGGTDRIRASLHKRLDAAALDRFKNDIDIRIDPTSVPVLGTPVYFIPATLFGEPARIWLFHPGKTPEGFLDAIQVDTDYRNKGFWVQAVPPEPPPLSAFKKLAKQHQIIRATLGNTGLREGFSRETLESFLTPIGKILAIPGVIVLFLGSLVLAIFPAGYLHNIWRYHYSDFVSSVFALTVYFFAIGISFSFSMAIAGLTLLGITQALLLLGDVVDNVINSIYRRIRYRTLLRELDQAEKALRKLLPTVLFDPLLPFQDQIPDGYLEAMQPVLREKLKMLSSRNVDSLKTLLQDLEPFLGIDAQIARRYTQSRLAFLHGRLPLPPGRMELISGPLSKAVNRLTDASLFVETAM